MMQVCQGHRGDGARCVLLCPAAQDWGAVAQHMLPAAWQWRALGGWSQAEPPRQPICTDFLNDLGTDLYTIQKTARSNSQIGLVEER